MVQHHREKEEHYLDQLFSVGFIVSFFFFPDKKKIAVGLVPKFYQCDKLLNIFGNV